MSKGVVMIAHNSTETDYLSMAEYAASRVSRYLNLPVTIITDVGTYRSGGYQWDQVKFVPVDSSNKRKKSAWLNKGRYRVYELSPYDETLVLDTDYMVNSNQLSRLFDMPSDFLCHRSTFWLGKHSDPEMLNPLSEIGITSYWATVMRFRRSARVERIFNMIQMVQENYEHYSRIYGFLPYTYRNDYALTIALNTVNGHVPDPEDFIPWNLVHVDLRTQIHRKDDTEYVLLTPGTNNRASYIEVRDQDFHVLDKQNFLQLMS